MDPALQLAWTPLRYHPKQSKAWRTRARFIALACGRGSGKTELARRRVVRMLPVKKPWPDPIYFFALPTAVQARRVAWDKLKALVPKEWLKGDPRESDMVIETVFGSKLYLVGMDKPQRIEGNQWDGGVVDESCDQKPGHFTRSIRPALSHRNGWCWRIGVPKRFGIGAVDFKKAFDDWGSGKLGSQYESYTWPSSEIMTPEEIQAAMADMDQKDFEEQYMASWLSASGCVFHAFSEEHNVLQGIKYRPDLPIIVGSDFNVNPMAWVLIQRDPITKAFLVFDEVWLRNTHTQATLDHLFQRYGTHQGGWIFIGDATAKSRNTRASLSDYAQIRNDKRFIRAHVYYPDSNPAVVERFAATNRQLCNAAGQRKLFVHPKCKNLIHDLLSRAYQEGTRMPDDEGDVGHITDALGYPIHYLCPVLAETQGMSQIMVA